MSLRLQSLDYRHLQCTFSIPYVEETPQDANGVTSSSRPPLSCKLVISSAVRPKGNTHGNSRCFRVSFDPVIYAQRSLFEQRLNHDISAAIQEIGQQLVVETNSISQLLDFRVFIAKLAERSFLSKAVDVIARSLTELRFVFKANLNGRLYSTKIRFLKGDSFLQEIGTPMELPCRKILPILREWFRPCCETVFSYDRVLEGVGVSSDNGTSLEVTEKRIRLNVQASSPLSKEEIAILEHYFRSYIYFPPFQLCRIRSFQKLLNCPLTVLRELIRLLKTEVESSRKSSGPTLRLCLFFDPPMDFHYDARESVVFFVLDFRETMSRVSKRFSIGVPRILLPLRYSFRDRCLFLWKLNSSGQRIPVSFPEGFSNSHPSLNESISALRSKSATWICKAVLSCNASFSPSS